MNERVTIMMYLAPLMRRLIKNFQIIIIIIYLFFFFFNFSATDLINQMNKRFELIQTLEQEVSANTNS